jgi:peptidoglycan/LPS O-acetylase OafA/YrhL
MALKPKIHGQQTEFYELLRKLSSSAITALKPSFLHTPLRTASSKPQRRSAWLDGVRGIAAFLVFVYHFQHMFHRAYEFGYASNGGIDDHWLIQLPIIRLIANGQAQVPTFYVLSGISLSLRPLEMARSHAWDVCFDGLFSSVFRRALRLYLPVLAVQICVILATLLGLYNHAYALSNDWPFGGTNEVMHQVLDSNWAQFQDWLKAMWVFANPFVPNRPRYNVHLWTIPIEFRNSIVLFVSLIGFSKLRPRIRISLTLVLWTYCICVDQGETALFYAGMVIAEYMLILDETVEQLSITETSHKRQTILSHGYWCAVCLVGLHLLSCPPFNSHSSLGFMTLNRLTPRFITSIESTWQRIGAAVLVYALSGSALLRRPFETPLASYLGKISFPLYIVHGPLNHMLGLWLVEMFWVITGSESFIGYESGVVLAFCMETIAVVWVADLVMRAVDGPSVRLGRVLQKKWAV